MMHPGMERFIQPINPFPYIYKARYNFNFKESLQDKVDSYLEASNLFLQKIMLQIPKEKAVLLASMFVEIKKLTGKNHITGKK